MAKEYLLTRVKGELGPEEATVRFGKSKPTREDILEAFKKSANVAAVSGLVDIRNIFYVMVTDPFANLPVEDEADEGEAKTENGRVDYRTSKYEVREVA